MSGPVVSAAWAAGQIEEQIEQAGEDDIRVGGHDLPSGWRDAGDHDVIPTGAGPCVIGPDGGVYTVEIRISVTLTPVAS
ncbi:hypothetical protein [Frankia sp. Cas3]|uniref:hypothetical protein n=1 Tax=Frankia sp. Cas3 TaxID=3073926 RepID=UPI002AD3202F|nr:hypothetical protein [Frankia sp. Cas3]